MACELELFYFPSSYYSQKAYLTLYEKNLPFRKRYVYIHFGEQNEEWYLRMNPNGQVPVLKDGSDVISGSEEIIDYVDRKTKDDTCLVPDATTPLGQRVTDARKLLDDVPVGLITYGVLLHPELQPKPLAFLKKMGDRMNRDSFEKSTRTGIENCKRQQAACPSLYDAMAKKIEALQWRLDNFLDQDKIRDALGDLQNTFDRIEQELERSKRDAQSDDTWLCGTTFTAADIVMAVLFNRLATLGIDEQYYSAITKRPLVFNYRERLYCRPVVKRVIQESSMEETMKLFRRKVLKNIAKKSLKVVAAVGVLAVVAYGVREYFSKR